MQTYLKEVARGKKGARHLTYEEASEVARQMISGEATDAQVAAFLIALRLKGQSAEEIRAFINQFRVHATPIQVSPTIRERLIDVAGPYDGRQTFAATVPVSILLAERGIPSYLHSSDTLPPKKGTSIKDIVERLGVHTTGSAQDVGSSLDQQYIGVAWTEKLCPTLSHLKTVRAQIGVRSFLNTVEKLLNLSHASAVIVGIFHKTVLDVHIEMLRAMGFKQSYIVQGIEGSEDVPIHRKSVIYEVTSQDVHTHHIDPQAFGLKYEKDPTKENLTLAQQVNIIDRLLEGEVRRHRLL
ncbi:anthranilate phosphoribosyltransferase [Caldalkalibacillus salinus]|uniref:anthranilate phosphoribosyltransferase n=1 Tax=Caldalkalibacillus salinus TaxID=2803787 RepID=UPI001921481D|nr:anthranilate phosphoribosyltransferase [Caldalkalibacillus salinus]